ncbi:MAG: PqqD family protein, partial [Bacteroidales bacterium]
MISASSIPSHSPRVVFRRINDECLLIPLTDNIADMDSLYRLNETGVFIWELIDGNRDIMDITAMMAEEFDVEAAEAEKDIMLFLEQVK